MLQPLKAHASISWKQVLQMQQSVFDFRRCSPLYVILGNQFPHTSVYVLSLRFQSSQMEVWDFVQQFQEYLLQFPHSLQALNLKGCEEDIICVSPFMEVIISWCHEHHWSFNQTPDCESYFYQSWKQVLQFHHSIHILKFKFLSNTSRTVQVV